jgi:hypothetical protein
MTSLYWTTWMQKNSFVKTFSTVPLIKKKLRRYHAELPTVCVRALHTINFAANIPRTVAASTTCNCVRGWQGAGWRLNGMLRQYKVGRVCMNAAGLHIYVNVHTYKRTCVYAWVCNTPGGPHLSRATPNYTRTLACAWAGGVETIWACMCASSIIGATSERNRQCALS